jgi:hypothetical protein
MGFAAFLILGAIILVIVSSGNSAEDKKQEDVSIVKVIEKKK